MSKLQNSRRHGVLVHTSSQRKEKSKMLENKNIHGVMFHKSDCAEDCPMSDKENWAGCIYYDRLTKQTICTCPKVTWKDKTEAEEYIKCNSK